MMHDREIAARITQKVAQRLVGYVRREKFEGAVDFLESLHIHNTLKNVASRLALIDLGMRLAIETHGHDIVMVDNLEAYQRIRRGETSIPRGNVLYGDESAVLAEFGVVMIENVPENNPLRMYYERTNISSQPKSTSL